MALLRIGLVTLFSIVFLTSCFDYEDVEFKGVQSLGLKEPFGGNVAVRIDVKVNNPNNYNIKMKKSTLDVFVNGLKVCKTKMQNNIVLKKNHEDVYPLYLTLGEKELKNSALASITTLMTGSVKVRVKGDVKTKAYGILKKFPIDMEKSVNLSSFF